VYKTDHLRILICS